MAPKATRAASAKAKATATATPRTTRQKKDSAAKAKKKAQEDHEEEVQTQSETGTTAVAVDGGAGKPVKKRRKLEEPGTDETVHQIVEKAISENEMDESGPDNTISSVKEDIDDNGPNESDADGTGFLMGEEVFMSDEMNEPGKLCSVFTCFVAALLFPR